MTIDETVSELKMKYRDIVPYISIFPGEIVISFSYFESSPFAPGPAPESLRKFVKFMSKKTVSIPPSQSGLATIRSLISQIGPVGVMAIKEKIDRNDFVLTGSERALSFFTSVNHSLADKMQNMPKTYAAIRLAAKISRFTRS